MAQSEKDKLMSFFDSDPKKQRMLINYIAQIELEENNKEINKTTGQENNNNDKSDSRAVTGGKNQTQTRESNQLLTTTSPKRPTPKRLRQDDDEGTCGGPQLNVGAAVIKAGALNVRSDSISNGNLTSIPVGSS